MSARQRRELTRVDEALAVSDLRASDLQALTRLGRAERRAFRRVSAMRLKSKDRMAHQTG